METTGQQVNASGLGQTPGAGQTAARALVPVLDGLILASGLVGQALVIVILAGRGRRKAGRPGHGTDTLLLALSAADLLLLLCLPFHTSAIALGYWPFGGFLCKAISFLGVACSAASVFTLAALAAARYLSVVHAAWAYRLRGRRRAGLAAALLWAPAAALAAPQFAFRTVSAASGVYCFAFLPDFSQRVYGVALFLCGFALPLGVIVFTYARIYCFLRGARRLGNAPRLERYQRQVTHTSALLVLVFTLLWLPSYALMFSFIGGSRSDVPGYSTVAILARLLASSAAVVNPALYGLVSRKFRGDLLQLGRERWARCRGCLPACPRGGGRDTVRPFELDTTSESGRN